MGSLADVALALYRKYRPAKFAEVVGQEHVTDPLRTALESGRINHAYLFSGPRGCGKTSSARILARSLNCEQGPTPEPCGVCASCVSLAPGGPGNIDVTELDAASHGGVDDTRELRDRAFFAPAESRYRVFIVDEAHMITTQGFNALLKIVEEPPEHLVFVFATTEPEKVLPTIRSRTHHYPFRLIPPGTLRKLLERICAEEGVAVAPAVLPLVIRAGGGSARDSLSVLDQLVSGAGPEGVTYERAVALLGVTDVSLIDDVVDALAAGDRAAVFEAVDRLVEAGHDPRRFATDLLQRLRDLTLLQAVPEAVGRGIVEAADDEVRRMVEQSGKFGAATLTRYGEILHTGLTEMRGATAPRLLLELLCARMLLPAATTAEPALLERLERLERRSAIAASPPAPGEAGDDAGHGRQFDRPSARAGSAPGTSQGAGPNPGARGGPDERGGETPGAPQAAAEHSGLVVVTRESGVAAAAAEGAAPPKSEPGLVAGSAGPGVASAGRGQPDLVAAGRGGPDTGANAPDVTAPGRSGPRVSDAGRGGPEVSDVGRGGADAPAVGRDLPASGSVGLPQAGAVADAGGGTERAPSGGPAAREAGAAEQRGVAEIGAADVRRVWQEIQDAVKQRKKRTAALLVSATVRAVEHDTLVLSIGTAPLARLLAEQSNTDVIAEALHAVLGVRWRVRCEHGDGPAPGPAGRGAAIEQRLAPNPPSSGPAEGRRSGPGTDGRSGSGGSGSPGGPTAEPAIGPSAAAVGSTTAGAGSTGPGPTADGGVRGSGGTAAPAGSGVGAQPGDGPAGAAGPPGGAGGSAVATGDGAAGTGAGVSGPAPGGPRDSAAGSGAVPGAGPAGSGAGGAVAESAGVGLASGEVDSATGGGPGGGTAGPVSSATGGPPSGGPVRSAAGDGGGAASGGLSAPVGPGAGSAQGSGSAASGSGGGPAEARPSGSATAGAVSDGAPSSGSPPATPPRPPSGQVPSGGAAPGGASAGGAGSNGAAAGSARPGRVGASGRPQFQRPSMRAGARPTVADEAVPLPPEPPDDDVPPDDEEAMLAELDAAPDGQAAGEQVPVVSDPEAAAIALLTTQLGARAINPR